jgi:hypothetical protein
MNRIITTLLQLIIVGGALVCLRLMWSDLKADLIEIKNDLRKK